MSLIIAPAARLAIPGHGKSGYIAALFFQADFKCPHLRSIRLRALFEPHLDVSDIKLTDKERDQKILSRCLAAFAIYAIAACSPEAAAAAVWDGSGDNGIDAAYFDQSDLCVVFVQSKWINKGSGEPEAKELGPFITGVKDAIEQNQENFGARVQTRLADILVRINTPGTSIHLALVTTGASSLAKPGQADES